MRDKYGPMSWTSRTPAKIPGRAISSCSAPDLALYRDRAPTPCDFSIVTPGSPEGHTH